jgi:hypothetical protein
MSKKNKRTSVSKKTAEPQAPPIIENTKRRANGELDTRVTFEATDRLLGQLHDAYAALIREKPTVDHSDDEYPDLKRLILAVGEAVNVWAMGSEPLSPKEEAQIKKEMRADQARFG